MIFCPRCGKKLNKVMHFEDGKSSQFSQCKSCHFETFRKPLLIGNLFKDDSNTNNKKKK